MLDAALRYAERGWPVLPLHAPAGAKCSCGRRECSSPGKHPKTMNGSKAATTDSVQITKWWDMWPDSNVGIATGNGLTVLDVESYGETELERLIDGQEWPRVSTVYTGGGGLHFYFAGNGRNSVKQLGHGIDVRGAGGFVVAPPSLHASGVRYAWLVEEAIPQVWPEYLVPPAKDGLFDGTAYVGHGTRYAKAALQRETETVRAAPVGTRNDVLNRAAFALARFIGASELSSADVGAALLDAATAAGLPQQEAEQTILSGLRGRS